MTRLTQMIIGTRDDIHVSTMEKNGKFGFWISEGEYLRPLLSSQPVFESKEAAESSANAVIEDCKKASVESIAGLDAIL